MKCARDYQPDQVIPISLGRPLKLTATAKTFIYSITYARPDIAAREISKTLSGHPFKIDVCERTINIYRKKCGFKFGPKIRQTAQTASSILQRLEFALYHLRNDTCWGKTVFSDESYFKLCPGKKFVWRLSGDYRKEVCTSEVAHPPSILVWGAIGLNFKSNLVIIEGSVNSQIYTSTI